MSRPIALELARHLHMLSALTTHLLEADAKVGDTSATFTQVQVLKWLAAAPPRRAIDVARFLSASAPAATQVLARLKAKGLLEAHPHPTDARSGELEVTALGRRLARAHDERKLRLLERVLADTSTENRRAIQAGLAAAVELLLQAETKQLDLCLHCGAHESPHCLMRRHGHRCPTERSGTAQQPAS
ncbi:MAG: MarR family transcriptional regulator [Planctomycetes bacterium]|nr:MarR family transcriptional regulator [Planctomycetota bacterium]